MGDQIIITYFNFFWISLPIKWVIMHL